MIIHCLSKDSEGDSVVDRYKKQLMILKAEQLDV